MDNVPTAIFLSRVKVLALRGCFDDPFRGLLLDAGLAAGGVDVVAFFEAQIGGVEEFISEF